MKLQELIKKELKTETTNISVDIPNGILKIMDKRKVQPAFKRNLFYEYIKDISRSDKAFEAWLNKNKDILDDHI